MLNAMWACMILLGVIYAAFTGNMAAVTDAALDSAGEAISLCITMAGVMALWMGLMEIGQKSGMIEKLAKGLGPFLSFLFPRIPKKHPAREYIATNVIANILGLGWAATPAGLKAMEELANLEKERGNPEYGKPAMGTQKSGLEIAKEAAIGGNRSASNEMCTFLIINISSLQLIPVNMIAYRSQYGSVNPAIIVGPAIIATIISTIVAVVYCKVMDRERKI